MFKTVTPGTLAKYGIGLLLAWVLFVVVAVAIDAPDGIAPWAAWLFWIPAVVLLVMAGVAKAVQIGVRSSRD